MDFRNATSQSSSITGIGAAAIRSRTLATSNTSGPSDVYEQAQGQRLVTTLNDRAAMDPQGFRQALELAMGPRADRQTVDALLDTAIAGDLPMPNVRFVDPGALGAGAQGAYDARDGGTILLDRSLLSDRSALEQVFTEEAGHHFDALLGTGDAAGDEGAVFARSLLGDAPSGSELSTLRAENDHGSVTLGGHVIAVEFSLGSDTPGGSPEGIGGNESGIGGGSTHTNGNSDSDRLGVTKPARTTTIEQPVSVSQPTTLPGPVSVPPGPVRDPIDQLNDLLNGNTPQSQLGPVVGGTATRETGGLVTPSVPAPPIAGTTLPLNAPLAPPSWLTQAGRTVGGWMSGIGRGIAAGASAFGAGAAALGVGLVSMVMPGNRSDRTNSAMPGTDLTVQHHSASLAPGHVLDEQGKDTGILVNPVIGENGAIVDWVPVSEADSRRLEGLTGTAIEPSDIPVYMAEPRDIGHTNPVINPSKQDRHAAGVGNGRSELDLGVDAQELLDEALSGEREVVGYNVRGEPIIDFGREIGTDANSQTRTQYAAVISGRTGSHIVPANPATIL